jgi:hypothetical protein
MKALIFPFFAAIALLTSPTASAQDRTEARNDNYGYDKNHQVTPEERARWEAAHKDGRKDDRRADRKDDGATARKDGRKDEGVADRKDGRREDGVADRKDGRKDNGVADRKEGGKDARNDSGKGPRKDDRKGKDVNYGFDKNHQVTPEERTRWEEAHKNDAGRQGT